MRQKDNPINPGNEISKKILDLLKMRQGDETLYGLSKHIGMQQGTLRRKLENPSGWDEVKYINLILDFFSISYNAIFYNSISINSDKDYINYLENNIQTLAETNTKLQILLDAIGKLKGHDLVDMVNKNLGKIDCKNIKSKVYSPDDPVAIAFSKYLKDKTDKKKI